MNRTIYEHVIEIQEEHLDIEIAKRVAAKFIGSIGPVGETNYDNKCLHNMDKLQPIMEHYADILADTAAMLDAPEHSIKEAAKKAEQIRLELLCILSRGENVIFNEIENKEDQ